MDITLKSIFYVSTVIDLVAEFLETNSAQTIGHKQILIKLKSLGYNTKKFDLIKFVSNHFNPI